MWDKLKKQIQVEMAQITDLFCTHHVLLEKCQNTRPDTDEIPAVAAILHSFYTGIENIFKRISVELDGMAPTGVMWHSPLLKNMASPNTNRSSVISYKLYEELQEYLDFRHVFRHAYTFELKWDKMASLAQRSNDILHRLDDELRDFMETL